MNGWNLFVPGRKKISWPRTWGAWRDLKSQGALKKIHPPQAGLWVKVFGNKCRFSDESCIIFQPYDTRFIFIFWQIRILSERKNAKFHIHSKWTFDLSSYLEFYWESIELYLSLSKLTEMHFKMHANFECIERFEFFFRSFISVKVRMAKNQEKWGFSGRDIGVSTITFF